LRHLTYAALSVPQPPLPNAAVPSDELMRFAGTYDFGPSLSARDRRAPIPAFAFSGVGLEIAVSDKVTVLRATDKGPGARAGVIAGDIITEIDGTPVAGLALDPVLAKLRGAPGTSVRFKLADKDVTIVREWIRPPGARLEVQVIDGALSVEAVGLWSVLDFEKGKPVSLKSLSPTEFQLGSGERTRLAFTSDGAGNISGAILNPGPLQVSGTKVK
jgi:membrane-associated protease RseP (regulator of RpoE activity)